ncbi:hypothetical protein QTP88_023985 [Uroleucon formosanum]
MQMQQLPSPSNDTRAVSNEQKFYQDYFLAVVDQAIVSINQRFEQLSQHSENFGFLYNIENLKLFEDETLRKHCMDLEILLKDESTCGSFPNISIALRILLTLPITTASAERSFSKLKIIKNYLRTTMVQERLSDLAIISIERDLCENIDYKDIIEKFAEIKARKINF